MSIRRKYLITLGMQAFQVGAMAIMMILVAQTLGPKGKGAVALMLAVAALVSSLTHLTLPWGTVYYLGTGRIPLAAIAANALVYTVTIGVGVSLLLWAGYRGIDSRFQMHIAPELWGWAALLVVPTYLVEFGAAMLMGLRRFGRLALANGAVGCVFLAAFVLTLRGPEATVHRACLLFLGYRLTRAVALWAAVPWRETQRLQPDAGAFRRVLAFSLVGHIGTMLQIAVYRLGLLFVNALVGLSAAGLFSAAMFFADVPGHLAVALSGVLFPEVAARGGTEARSLGARACRQTLWLTLGAALTVGLAAPVLVPLLMGEAFRSAVPGVWLLLPGIVAIATTRVVEAAVSGGGWPWGGALSAGVGLCVIVAGNLLLVPRWGFLGAAVATSSAHLAQVAIIVAVFHAQTGVPLQELWAFRPQDFAALSQFLRRGLPW